MIPVVLKPEPAEFDAKVRIPGKAFLTSQGIPPAATLKMGAKLPPYWRVQLPALHSAYDGICAYLGLYVEICTGGTSVDHFAPKSKALTAAYEWDNYRLACTTLNSKKRDFTTIIDPFNVVPDSFSLNLATGAIFPSEDFPAAIQVEVDHTIQKLKLDRYQFRKLRARWYDHYVKGDIVQSYLRAHAPFVWYEANRQKLL